MDMILLAAGASRRFLTQKPKYLLPMQDGRPMFVTAIDPFLNQVDQIHLVIQQQHELDYSVSVIARQYLGNRVSLVVVPGLTAGPADSALQACNTFSDRPIFVKDCDSFFKAELSNKNYVCATNWNASDSSKCYIDHLDEQIFQLHEKRPIGQTITVGGYGFASSELFRQHCSGYIRKGELYVSHIINSMLPGFSITYVRDYVDVGTQSFYDNIVR